MLYPQWTRYLVWSGGSVNGGYVYNARFIVQSNDRSPQYLDDRVEAFVTGFREVRAVLVCLLLLCMCCIPPRYV